MPTCMPPTKRIDWSSLRDQVDLVEVATRLLGPAPGRRGERSDRHWWQCPFHADSNPSFCVRPGDRQWRCFGCAARGDALDLVRSLDPTLTFVEAVASLTGNHPAPAPSRAPRPAPPPRPVGPEGMSLEDAVLLVTEAEARLWTSDGVDALTYLRGRGLTDATIRVARLGYAPDVEARTRDGRVYHARGIIIPWFAGEQPALIKVRQPDGQRPKYAQVFRETARLTGLYPGPGVIRPGKPLIAVEGELDAILLGQELHGLASVITVGSASSRPTPDLFGAMLSAWPRIVATDADDAGDTAASGWPASVRRVRPPAPHKDWNECFLGRINLRQWWADTLAGRDPSHTLAELLTWRWGPATDDPTPGLVVDRSDPAAMRDALLAGADDPEAAAERLAIQCEADV